MILNVKTEKKGASGMIPDDSYIRIFGFMRNEMGLQKTELLTYALIYSYFRNCSSFNGTREYISKWVGSSHSAVESALNSLLKKGYITKTSERLRGHSVVAYTVNVEALPPCAEHDSMLRMCKEDNKREC